MLLAIPGCRQAVSLERQVEPAREIELRVSRAGDDSRDAVIAESGGAIEHERVATGSRTIASTDSRRLTSPNTN